MTPQHARDWLAAGLTQSHLPKLITARSKARVRAVLAKMISLADAALINGDADLSLFIGSSTEGLPIARALQAELDEEFEPLVWEQDFFVPTETTIGTLAEKAQNFDFAAFVFTPDDFLIIRGSANAAARDNVIFELGIFIGALGKEQVFIVRPRDRELRLPSDLAGVACLTYRSNRKDENLRAAIGPAATAIRSKIRRTLRRNVT